MPRKALLLTVLTLFTGILFAQQDQQNDSIPWYDYGMRLYDPIPCGGCPSKEKQDKPPQYFIESPYKYNNIKPIAVPDSLRNIEWPWLFKIDIPESVPVCL